MQRIRRSLQSLRSTALGRAALVALLGVSAFAVWNLTLRPYPDHRCNAPVQLVLGDEPDIPRPRSETKQVTDHGAVKRHVDRQRSLGILPPMRGDIDTERLRVAAEGRFKHEVSVVTNNYERRTAEAAREMHRTCVDQLATAGFWSRGLVVPAAGLAVLGAGRFIVGDRRRGLQEMESPRPSDPA